MKRMNGYGGAHLYGHLPITKADFENGGLRADSFVRSCHLFSIDESVIEYQAGKLKDEKVKEVIAKIIALLNA
jgi:hypothetical protein